MPLELAVVHDPLLALQLVPQDLVQRPQKADEENRAECVVFDEIKPIEVGGVCTQISFPA